MAKYLGTIVELFLQVLLEFVRRNLDATSTRDPRRTTKFFFDLIGAVMV